MKINFKPAILVFCLLYLSVFFSPFYSFSGPIAERRIADRRPEKAALVELNMNRHFFEVHVPLDIHDAPNQHLSVLVGRRGQAIVTISGPQRSETFNGIFNSRTGQIVIQVENANSNYSKLLLSFAPLKHPNETPYILRSLKIDFKLGGELIRKDQTITFSQSGKVEKNEYHEWSANVSIDSVHAYIYAHVRKEERLVSEIATYLKIDHGKTTSTEEKIFYRYGRGGNGLGFVRVASYYDEQGEKRYNAFYSLKNPLLETRTEAFFDSSDRQVSDRIKSWSDYMVIDLYVASRRIYYQENEKSNSGYYVDEVKNAAGTFTPKMTVYRVNGVFEKQWIVQGRADLFSTETDDILFELNQIVNGYRVSYGSTHDQYGFIFEKYDQIAQKTIRITVDYPTQNTVKLDGHSYQIRIDAIGQIQLEELGPYVSSQIWPPISNQWYLVAPASMGIDHEGNIYVISGGSSAIKKYSSTGEFLYEINNYNFLNEEPCFACRPNHIAFDDQDNFYVTDSVSVKKFSKDGQYLLEFKIPTDLFSRPFNSYDLAVGPQNIIYVTDVNNQCVHRFDAVGNYLGSFGQGILSSPVPKLGVLVDSQGAVYVADDNYFRIHKFDAEGKHLFDWSWRDSADQHAYDEIFMIDSKDVLYVGHQEAGFLKKYDAEGNEIKPHWNDPKWFQSEEVVADGAIDAQGNIYVIGNHAVFKFDSNGRVLQKFASFTRDPAQGFFWPVGAVMSASGTLYIRDENQHIFIFDANYKPRAVWTLPIGLIPYPLADTEMAVNQAGEVFLSQGNLLVKLDSEGRVLMSRQITEIPSILAMEIDANGFLWISSENQILQLDGEGNILKSFDLSRAVQAALGHTIRLRTFAFDVQGNIVVSDPARGVFTFNTEGQLIKNFVFEAHRVPPYGINFTGFSMNVHVDPEGNIFVLFPEYGEIQKYDSQGNLLAAWGEVGTELGRMVTPFFITTDPNGNVVAVEHGNNRIQIFSPA